jgi:hypothetical protein
MKQITHVDDMMISFPNTTSFVRYIKIANFKPESCQDNLSEIFDFSQRRWFAL